MDRKREEYLERRIERLLEGRKKPRFGEEEALLPEPMRKALEKLDRYHRKLNHSLATRTNQLEAVVDIGLFLSLRQGREHFEEATEEDLEAYQVEVEMPPSVWNVNRVVIKNFYWMLEGNGRGRRKFYPEKTDTLEAARNGNGSGELKPEKVDYYRKMASYADRLALARDHPRDRALIWLTFDAGARLDEITGLSVRSVTLPPGEHYGELMIPRGKTGGRPVTFVRARPYLLDWLKVHPNSRDPEAPLWAQLRGGGIQALSYRAVQGVFQKAAKSTGLPLTAHDLRHGRATEAAQLNWSESKMRFFFGWDKRSQMPSRYVHLAGEDAKKQVLADAGIETAEQPELQGQPRACPNCGHENTSIAFSCGVCQFPLTVEEAEKFRVLHRVNISGDQISVGAVIGPSSPDTTDEEKLRAFMLQALRDDEMLKTALREALRE